MVRLYALGCCRIFAKIFENIPDHSSYVTIYKLGTAMTFNILPIFLRLRASVIFIGTAFRQVTTPDVHFHNVF
jgi:hypothetical protein